MNWSTKILIIIGFSALLLGSCKKDKLFTGNARLTFSVDTVIFDTVFTQIGTITKHFKVYNPYSQPINISSIYISGRNDSIFRMNVDGVPGSYHQNIEIAAKDSMFIFVEATLNPNNANNPMIIEDNITFETNGNQQKVDLVAWGQDAYYLFSPTGDFAFSIVPNQPNVIITLPNDKPYVVYGYAIVDSTQILEIPEGTSLHFHKYSGLYVAPGASLKVNGTLENPVVFESDRLDSEYRDVPGQWGHPALSGGIILAALSYDNEINYAEIKHGTFGLRVDSFANASAPTVVINNTKIHNMSYVGLSGQTSNIVANNSVFTNCGLHTVALLYGGEYEFNHCSLGNYWSFDSRQTGQLLLNNFFESSSKQIISRNLTKAQFTNCVIYGVVEDEIEFSKDDGAEFNYSFIDCLVKSTKTSDSQFTNCIFNPARVDVDGVSHDPVYNDPTNDKPNFKLFSASTALDHGQIIPGLETDILGTMRSSPADLGAYEFVE